MLKNRFELWWTAQKAPICNFFNAENMFIKKLSFIERNCQSLDNIKKDLKTLFFISFWLRNGDKNFNYNGMVHILLMRNKIILIYHLSYKITTPFLKCNFCKKRQAFYARLNVDQ